ncbi:MAG: C4-dicarboxylate ABC transporter substrate-binding protein, partial [Planctomycetota bacterium]
DLPRRDTRLVAPAAMLVARADTHSGIATLAIYAATNIHGPGDALDPPGTYPARSVGDVAMSDAADYALRTGPNFLHRRLPFWAASLVDRLLILLLPLLGLLIPLLRVAPPTYRWRVRRKIYKWYKRLNAISLAAKKDADLPKLRADVAALDKEISEVNVPLSYMDELYDLRLHVQFLERRLERASRA